MEIFDKEFDGVVKSVFCSGKANYEYAVDYFFPQIDKYYAQRKELNKKFYEKLERDISKGCIMPPITLALVVNDIETVRTCQKEDIEEILNTQHNNLYILDGIQRLNTLNRAYTKDIKDFKIYFNFLISDSDDRLLYRMITLNNGQKPMSARHQIEVLAYNMYDFDDTGITIQTERGRSKRRIRGAFNKDDIIKGYISYLSQSVNIDNQKIIESKLDELIADKIIESDVTQSDSNFNDVIELIETYTGDEYLLKWIKQTNNLIGFCAGVGKSYEVIKSENNDTLKYNIEKFEKAFESFDISKIKLGHLRRISVQFFISKYDLLKTKSQAELEDSLSQASLLFI